MFSQVCLCVVLLFVRESPHLWRGIVTGGAFPFAATEKAMEATFFSFYPSIMPLLCCSNVEMTELVAHLLLCEGGFQVSPLSASF